MATAAAFVPTPVLGQEDADALRRIKATATVRLDDGLAMAACDALTRDTLVEIQALAADLLDRLRARERQAYADLAVYDARMVTAARAAGEVVL